MRDLYFIVEGETELEFTNKILIPYLYKLGAQCHIQGYPITMSGGGHGFNNIEHFKNTVYPVMHYNGNPIITTLIDYFQLNSDTKLPGYTGCLALNSTDDKINYLETKLNDIVQNLAPYRFFIPYIQKHEMETLLFANPEEGLSFETDKIRDAVIAITNQYANIEDINGTIQGAPSNRLSSIYQSDNKKYDKVIDGIDIAELTGIEKILEKCPRFNQWIEKIIHALKNW